MTATITEKVKKKDLITALEIVSQALDKLDTDSANSEDQNEDEIVVTDNGELVTLELGKNIVKK